MPLTNQRIINGSFTATTTSGVEVFVDPAYVVGFEADPSRDDQRVLAYIEFSKIKPQTELTYEQAVQKLIDDEASARIRKRLWNVRVGLGFRHQANASAQQVLGWVRQAIVDNYEGERQTIVTPMGGSMIRQRYLASNNFREAFYRQNFDIIRHEHKRTKMETPGSCWDIAVSEMQDADWV